MKKSLLIAAVAGVFILSSCKKDYICECTSTSGTSSVTTSTIINDTKKNAKAACEYTLTVGGATTTCVIK